MDPVALLAFLSDGFRARTEGPFLDLVWEKHRMKMNEIVALNSIVVEWDGSQRQLVFLPIHSEFRYWLTTDRDPDNIEVVTHGYGVVRTLDEAVTLCEEFLRVGVDVAALTSVPRRVLSPDIAVPPSRTERGRTT